MELTVLGDTRSAAERADAAKGSGSALAVDIRSVSDYLAGSLDSDHVHVPYESAFRESGEDIKEEYLQVCVCVCVCVCVRARARVRGLPHVSAQVLVVYSVIFTSFLCLLFRFLSLLFLIAC
jgi:hypothetical protein